MKRILVNYKKFNNKKYNDKVTIGWIKARSNKEMKEKISKIKLSKKPTFCIYNEKFFEEIKKVILSDVELNRKTDNVFNKPIKEWVIKEGE